MSKNVLQFQTDMLRLNELASEIFDSKQVRVTYRPDSFKTYRFWIKFYPGIFNKDNSKILAEFDIPLAGDPAFIRSRGAFLDENIDMITEKLHKAKLELLCLR